MEHHFEEALKGFREWIRLLHYSASNAYNSPRKTGEFLRYALQQGKTSLPALDQALTHNFFTHLGTRKNQRRPGGLSLNSIWNYRYAINLFARYLRETGQAHFIVEEVLAQKPITPPKEILTPAEIKSLYEATGESPLGLRDRAMLAVFYGCGVRKNEGAHLDVKDVMLERNRLYVRTGKGYKERYVPLTRHVKADLENYLHHGRPGLLKYNADTRRLFIAVTGKPITGVALYDRLQTLKAQAGITRPVGLHTLRHTIATHLLQSGMKLEQIAKFLGHSTLESTQLYTHITQL